MLEGATEGRRDIDARREKADAEEKPDVEKQNIRDGRECLERSEVVERQDTPIAKRNGTLQGDVEWAESILHRLISEVWQSTVLLQFVLEMHKKWHDGDKTREA